MVRPGEFTSETALMLCRYLTEAGLPDGVCLIIAGAGDIVRQALPDSEEVGKIAFTGSTRMGWAAIAASAGNIKKLPLELGGKSPSAVFADCGLDAAMDGVIKAAAVNMGECFTAGSRPLVRTGVAAPACDGVRDGARIVCGDDPKTVRVFTARAPFWRMLRRTWQRRGGGRRCLALSWQLWPSTIRTSRSVWPAIRTMGWRPMSGPGIFPGSFTCNRPPVRALGRRGMSGVNKTMGRGAIPMRCRHG